MAAITTTTTTTPSFGRQNAAYVHVMSGGVVHFLRKPVVRSVLSPTGVKPTDQKQREKKQIRTRLRTSSASDTCPSALGFHCLYYMHASAVCGCVST